MREWMNGWTQIPFCAFKVTKTVIDPTVFVRTQSTESGDNAESPFGFETVKRARFSVGIGKKQAGEGRDQIDQEIAQYLAYLEKPHLFLLDCSDTCAQFWNKHEQVGTGDGTGPVAKDRGPVRVWVVGQNSAEYPTFTPVIHYVYVEIQLVSDHFLSRSVPSPPPLHFCLLIPSLWRSSQCSPKRPNRCWWFQLPAQALATSPCLARNLLLIRQFPPPPGIRTRGDRWRTPFTFSRRTMIISNDYFCRCW